MSFPPDDYTPHGYLHTPTHTRNLSPRGVLRSWGAGFRWHAPAFAGMYGGRRETYRAGFRLGLGGTCDLDALERASSPYHSKDLISFDLARDGAELRATFQLVGEHALHATVALSGGARLTVQAEYTRLLSAAGEWGESGLVGRSEDGLLILQGFEDGDAFALWCSRPVEQIHLSPEEFSGEARGLRLEAWELKTQNSTLNTPTTVVVGNRGETVALHAVLAVAAGDGEVELMLARGRTADQARAALEQARRTAPAEQARKRASDSAFWETAPRLEGDWPAHWRRGLIYDQETVRMMVRQPVGIYRHIWDAMQIQAPRVVLAEAAMDALLLAYADPALAQELLLGTFLDAPAPNVPCSREDGSYNMVSADGTVCGTAPSWGYPWLVLEWLWALRPDARWLEQIYPRLAEHLEWWLTRRSDAEGWLHYACSWESGQDDSPRFGAQPLGGGHPVRHVRPVDLHAALAHACAAMSRFARALGRAEASARWAAQADDMRRRTDLLWGGTRYADFDTQAGRPTVVDDVMLLAPLALGVAGPERLAALRPAVETIAPAQLTWPMGAWTAVEAARAAGLPERAAELAAAVCERAYRFWDARTVAPGRTLPGIACEYWPTDGRCGGEGYGWGAFTTHLLLRCLAGLEPHPDGLALRPNLPPAWRQPGRSYRLRWHWRSQPLAIAIEPLPSGRCAVTINNQRHEIAWGEAIECVP
ncbi:MAG TPA: hypothetical protein VFS21_25350 [Roseiflexaceae bacterium]|nr:hypothetical protein [Roseiflexaceae bacterium]